MNLEIIKPKTTFTIEVGRQECNLSFTLKSFAYLEELFGTVEKAINEFNTKDETAVREFLYAGLQNKTKKQVEKIRIDENLLRIIADAVSSALPENYKMDEAFDWSLLYYIIRPALYLSENEFWNSTPKKLLEFTKVLDECKQQQQKLTDAENRKQAVEAVMSW